MAIVIAEGCDFPYFSMFSGAFLAVAGIATFALHRRPEALLRTGLLLAILVGSFAVSLSPNLLYFWRHGTNTSPTHVSHHPWQDGEDYSLKPVQLLLPAPGHPLPAMERVRVRYYAGTKLPSEGDSMAMGTAASLGFFVLLAAVPLGARSCTERGRLFHLLGILLVAGIVFCTVGGIGTMFNLLSLTVVRSYCRASIFLAFFSLAGFCGILDVVYRRHFERSVTGRVLGAIAVAGLMYLGCRDQMGQLYVESFATVREEYFRDRDFVGRIEAAVPAGATIFQYPYVAYGSYSNAEHGMLPYSHFRAYVHSKSARWSFGAMHGRAGDDRHSRIAALPTPEAQLRTLAALGFEGVYVDRSGYADRGEALEAEWKRLGLADPIETADGRLAFYSMAAYRRSVLAGLTRSELDELRAAIETYPEERWGDQFYPEERGTEKNWRRWRWSGALSSLTLTNTTGSPQPIRVKMEIRAEAGPARLQLRGPGIFEEFDVGGPGTMFDRTVVLQPGANRFEFRYQGPVIPAPHRPYPLAFAVHDFAFERVESPAGSR